MCSSILPDPTGLHLVAIEACPDGVTIVVRANNPTARWDSRWGGAGHLCRRSHRTKALAGIIRSTPIAFSSLPSAGPIYARPVEIIA